MYSPCPLWGCQSSGNGGTWQESESAPEGQAMLQVELPKLLRVYTLWGASLSVPNPFVSESSAEHWQPEGTKMKQEADTHGVKDNSSSRGFLGRQL